VEVIASQKKKERKRGNEGGDGDERGVLLE